MPRETVLEREDQTSILIISDRIVGAAPRRAAPRSALTATVDIRCMNLAIEPGTLGDRELRRARAVWGVF